jgi:hypothetical protein
VELWPLVPDEVLPPFMSEGDGAALGGAGAVGAAVLGAGAAGAMVSAGAALAAGGLTAVADEPLAASGLGVDVAVVGVAGVVAEVSAALPVGALAVGVLQSFLARLVGEAFM